MSRLVFATAPITAQSCRPYAEVPSAKKSIPDRETTPKAVGQPPRRLRTDRGRAWRLRRTGLAEGSLRHRDDEVGHGVQGQLPVGVEGVKRVETAEHPKHVSGLTDAHVIAEGAVVVQALGKVVHAALAI